MEASAIRWKSTSAAVPEPACQPGRYVRDGRETGPQRDICLPLKYTAVNLLPHVREGALAHFRDKGIVWQESVDDGPTNHLLSSQVQCVNALWPMTRDASLLQRAFGDVLDIDEVLPIEDQAFVSFEYTGVRDHLGEVPEGRVRRRGRYSTSADAAIRYRTGGDEVEIALIEWKFTESYTGELRPPRGIPREDRYRSLAEAEDSPLRFDVIPYEDLFVEPFYQLMRQQLLAARMETAGEQDARRVRVVHVAPADNAGLQASLLRDSHRATGETVYDVWRQCLRAPDRFLTVDSARFLDPALSDLEYRARYARPSSGRRLCPRPAARPVLESPWSLRKRLKLGREEFCQRLLTMLILGGPYPRWNTPHPVSERGLRFLRSLDALAFGEDSGLVNPLFVDEFDLPARTPHERGGAPDWAVQTDGRLWLIELKTERGSHRASQIPQYLHLGRHHHPERTLDIVYLTPPMPTTTVEVEEGQRYAHLTWDQVVPLVRSTWGDSPEDDERAICEHVVQVLTSLDQPVAAWRTDSVSGREVFWPDLVETGLRLAAAVQADGKQRAVEAPAVDLAALQELRVELWKRLRAGDANGVIHVRPWLWSQATSTGRALTTAGAESGYEVRLSRYQSPVA